MGLTRRNRSLLLIFAAAVAFIGVVSTVAVTKNVQLAATLSGGLVAIASLLISGLALVTARNQAEWAGQQVQLARTQAEHAGEQARLAALTVTYAYQPILLPVHDAVHISDRSVPEPHYPAIEAFIIPKPTPSDRVLLMDRSSGRAVFRLRNVGRGPALIVSGELVGHSGIRAALQGNPAIGPDQEERYSASFRRGRQADGPIAPQAKALIALWHELTKEKKYCERTLLLTVKYRSSAPEAVIDELEAIFDPRGTGQWHTQLIQRKASVN